MNKRSVLKGLLRLLALFGFGLVCAVAYLAVGPSEIDPGVWNPPAAPTLTGQYAKNTVLDDVELFFKGALPGPEDIAQDAEGRYYTGTADGRIYRVSPDLKILEVFAETGGRPLGLDFDAQGNLIVADGHKGLLSIDSAGTITLLTAQEGGLPFGFTDDVDVAADGAIYFTDASWKFHPPNYLADLMEHRPNGRFLKYDPATKTTTKLIGDLYFANGVAVSPDQTFVLINETWKYRILKYWLAGEKRGQWTVLVDNLPGFPDNIASNGRGTFWVALANPRNPMADTMLPYPTIRRILWQLPAALLPKAVRYSFALGIDGDGKVLHNLQGPSGKLAPVTSVNEFGAYLYLGSVEDDAFGRVPVPAGSSEVAEQ